MSNRTAITISSCVFLALLWVSLEVTFREAPHSFVVTIAPLAYDARFELFLDIGRGLYAQPSIVSYGGKSATRMEFELPVDTVRGVRLDPGSRTGRIVIESIEFGAQKWVGAELLERFKPVFDISESKNEGGFLTIMASGGDPQRLSQSSLVVRRYSMDEL